MEIATVITTFKLKLNLIKNKIFSGKNPIEDMKQQLLANETRVNLLQEQNDKLKRVIDKMQHLSVLPS